MLALVQRVSDASVEVDGQVVGSTGPGLLILLGVHRDDTDEEVQWVARKCAGLRVFQDAEDRMNRSVVDEGGGALVISQFTLYGDTSRGNRPSFTEAAPPADAERLYERFVEALRGLLTGRVETGVFGAMMRVRLTNEGPVTLVVEKKRS